MDSPNYRVYSIPAIPAQHHVVQYKDLRLQAIQTDPQSFSSSYERERALGYGQWRARLQSPDKATIIAAVTLHSLERLSWQNKWVGMTTVLGPKVLQEFGFTPPHTMERGGVSYVFVGLWVNPNHRGNGLGKKMVAAGLEWIQAHAEKSGTKQTVLLQVYRHNKPAIGLYSSMGFQLIEVDQTAEDGIVWMVMRS